MAVTSDVAQGTLTTSAATLVTGAAAATFVDITFTNYSGADVTLDLYMNGSADGNRLGKAITVDANGGYVEWTGIRLGSGDTIQAKASAGTSIAWTAEVTTP